MTLEEAKGICSKLAGINLKIWDEQRSGNKHEVDALRQEFSRLMCLVKSSGFMVKRGLTPDNKPKFTPKADVDPCIMIVNNRPSNIHASGDCTTRCVSFCTGEPYEKIRNEQLEREDKIGYGWRYAANWSQSLVSRGFVKVWLPRKISRKVLVRKMATLKVPDGVIATHSSGHVAALDVKQRKILDMWDSRGGRVDYIYVPEIYKEAYERWLKTI